MDSSNNITAWILRPGGRRQDNGLVTSGIQGEEDDPASWPDARQPDGSQERGSSTEVHLCGGGTMRRTQARYVSADVQRRTGQPRCPPRQRGPPARTFCDLTKHPLHDAQYPPAREVYAQ